MKHIKMQKGITLIALIITIIVLLILAVVAISVVQDSEIIRHANDSVSKYKEGEEKEKINLAYAEFILQKSSSDNPSLEVEDAIVTGDEKTGWEVIFNKTGNKYNLNADGSIGESIFKDNDEINDWEIAWVSDGTKWSSTKYVKGNEITEDYAIIAKIYKTGETITLIDDTEGDAYRLVIEGNGQLPQMGDTEKKVGYAWAEESYGYLNSNKPCILNHITDVEIKNGITNIPDGAFSSAINLVSVNIPDTVTTIGNSAFVMCMNLKNITLPEKLNFIGEFAFQFCTGLEKIVIPANVSTIGRSIFINCTSLSDVTIQEGVNIISYYAFSNCTSLRTITIPASITSIDSTAFSDSTNLKQIIIHKKDSSELGTAWIKSSVTDVQYVG